MRQGLRDWIYYEQQAVFTELLAAKSAMLALAEIPDQRSWADELQQMQLKREVARAAMRETPEQLETRSQKKAPAALATYRWIARVPADQPLEETLILEIHRRLVTGCDEDHCPPGRLRERDQNVTFGAPRHRGCEGGEESGTAIRGAGGGCGDGFSGA